MIVTAVAVNAYFALPGIAQAALHAAADKKSTATGGCGTAGNEGVNAVLCYVNDLTDWAVVIAIPLATLGTTVAGGMLMVGNRRAGTVFGGVVVGTIVVAAAKGIAA